MSLLRRDSFSASACRRNAKRIYITRRFILQVIPLAGAKSTGAANTRTALFIVGILATAVLAFVIGYYAGMSSSPRAASSCAPAIKSGATVTPKSLSKQQLSAYISKCQNICAASKSVGMNLSHGLCLNNDLNGYACAVVVHDSGHCPAYYHGSPELVFDVSCKYVGTYSIGGKK
jgi:hypothetical protein